jgi:hypothetical protein
VPVFSVGVRLPTGRDWQDASSPLLADVTGAPGAGLALAAGVERAEGRWMGGLSVEGELSLATPPEARPMAVTGSVGRALGSRWSLALTARHERTTALGGAGVASTAAGVRVVLGKPLAWRGYAGLSLPLAVAGGGQSGDQVATISAGWLLVR